MKIAIVGAGALGSLFGGLLAKAGHKVWLYNPSNIEHVRAVKAEGLRIETADGQKLHVELPATERMEEVPKPVDLVGIFVKAYRTEEALRQARALIGEATWLLSLQNGVGFEELLLESAPLVLRGTTAQGATLLAPGRIRWAGRGPTRIGPLIPPKAEAEKLISEIISALNTSGIEAHYEQDIRKALFEKLLVNAAINPLTALFDVPNGELVEDPKLREVLRDVVREAHPIVADQGVTLSLKEAIERVEGVCRATAQNISSMLQDVRKGRQTEIEFINGAIVREGERLKIPTPLNRLLTELVLRMGPD